MTGFPVPQPVVADQETEKGANSAQTGGGGAGQRGFLGADSHISSQAALFTSHF